MKKKQTVNEKKRQGKFLKDKKSGWSAQKSYATEQCCWKENLRAVWVLYSLNKANL